VGSRLGGCLCFVVFRRFDVEPALAEANSFLAECQQFCNIARGFFFGRRTAVTIVTSVNLSAGRRRPPAQV
jgi:hypothetical protein